MAMSGSLSAIALAMVLLAISMSTIAAQSSPNWGNVGHQVVAGVAQEMLSNNAIAQIRRLIPNGDMAAVATWADDVRHTSAYRWSAPLHFINTPDWLCQYSKQRDCQHDFCCDGAIQNYTQRLHDARLSMEHRTEALKFLIHFAGDIHQPLHVGFTTDAGGNSITVTYNGAQTNLHSVWDSGMIYYRIDHDFEKDQNKWRDSIVKRISTTWASLVPGWKQCSGGQFGACSSQWAVESIGAACKYAYVDEQGHHITKGASLGLPYYNHVLETVEEQIAKAAVRLANVLNLIFA